MMKAKTRKRLQPLSGLMLMIHPSRKDHLDDNTPVPRPQQSAPTPAVCLERRTASHRTIDATGALANPPPCPRAPSSPRRGRPGWAACRSNLMARKEKDGTRFVSLPYWVMRCEAWKQLSPHARCLLIELKGRFNGSNNGDIRLSIREAAACLHSGKDRARNALVELQMYGFIRMSQLGSFHYKQRHATTWTLTEYSVDGREPTKDFIRWGENKVRSSPQVLTVPTSGTET
jgi:hypothetical protein